MAQLVQLPLDAAMPPARILPRQAQDERLHLGGDGGPTTPLRPPVGPLASDQLAVPLQHRVRLEQEEVLLELAPRADGQPGERGGQDGQGQPLAARQPGRALALQQTHLVPQHENLEVLVAVAWSSARDQVDEERHEMREHEPEHPPLLFAHHRPAPRCAAPGAIIADREDR